MNIVISGSRVQVYGDEVQTYKQLPIGNYEVIFNMMQGFYLVKSQELEVKETKIYGNTIAKVAKCLDGFANVDRNFGVILSGAKGAGKSLFTRVLARSCIDRGLPVIKVTSADPGIAQFISSIEQECCVVFDEFDKVFFSKSDEVGPQSELLSLFDGMDNGKKLFIITCNSLQRLSNYLLDRPGRFHYHFTFGSPDVADIEAYLRDKLTPEAYAANAERLMFYASLVDITYDYLRAICFELNRGYSLEDTLADLNIAKDSDADFDITATVMVNGVERTFTAHGMDLKFRQGMEWDGMRLWSDSYCLRLYMNPDCVTYSDGGIKVDMSRINADTYVWDNKRDESIENFKIIDVKITKSSFRRARQLLAV